MPFSHRERLTILVLKVLIKFKLAGEYTRAINDTLSRIEHQNGQFCVKCQDYYPCVCCY